MNEEKPTNEPITALPPRKARSMLWRLVLLVPAIVCAVWGYVAYRNVSDADGVVTSFTLTTKPGLAGQTRDAYDSIDPRTPDLFLQFSADDVKDPIRLETHNDTVLGSGQTWTIPPRWRLSQIKMVEVYDENTLLKDKQLDRISINGSWTAEGQTFALTLAGTHPASPPYALPLLTAGATLGGLVLLKFVWDSAI